MELQLLLPGDVATTAFRVRPAERFRDICSRIKDEYELPSDRASLFLVADGIRPGSAFLRCCPGGMLDPDDTVKRRQDLLKAAAQIRVVPRDVITAVYSGQGPPKKMRFKASSDNPVARSTASEGPADGAMGPAEFMAVVVKFPPSYPMDVQTVDLPLHYSVGKTIRYMLDVALVSEERAESLVLVVPTDADGANLRRFKRSPLWPVLPNREPLGMFKALLGEAPRLELSYLSPDRWSEPLKAGAMLVKEGDSKWLKRYCLLKDRQLFFFPIKPTSQFADPVGRVFLELCTKLSLSDGGDNQVIKIAEKIGSKTRGFFLASNKADKLAGWLAALQLELDKSAATGRAPDDAALRAAGGFGLEGDDGGPSSDFDSAALDQRKTMDLKDIVSKESPSKLYGNFVKIGRGAFSNVWTACDKITAEKVAIKVIKIEKKTFKYVRGEVVTMQRFESHPNVVRYINSFVLPKVEQIWIVMEFLEGGSLIDYCAPEADWPEEQIAFVMRESFIALAYLHSKERIHRDIKSGNILVAGDGAIKLGDFGFATKLADGRDRAKTVLGS